MKIVSQNKLIKRNKKIGNYTTIGSLVILGLGLYISFTAQTSEAFTWSMVCLIVGFLLSQIGIFFGNRWGRSPRPDELISKELKGLDDKYTLYHYVTPVPHLLVGPAGIYVISTYIQGGKITYDAKKRRWQQKGGNLYMKWFAQEGLGRPDQEMNSSINDVRAMIQKTAEIPGLPEPDGLLVFTNPKAQVDAPEAHLATLQLDKLKDYVRGQAKRSPAPMDAIRLLQQQLPTESVE